MELSDVDDDLEEEELSEPLISISASSGNQTFQTMSEGHDEE